MLDYYYIKNHYRLIAVDLSRQKGFWFKSNLAKIIHWTIKNPADLSTDGTQSMFVLTVLEKINETRLKFSQGSVTILWKMGNYE